MPKECSVPTITIDVESDCQSDTTNNKLKNDSTIKATCSNLDNKTQPMSPTFNRLAYFYFLVSTLYVSISP